MLSGKIKQFPEIRFTGSGATLGMLTLDVDGADVRCIAWGKLAELICEDESNFVLGAVMTVNGYFRVREYRNADQELVEVREFNILKVL